MNPGGGSSASRLECDARHTPQASPHLAIEEKVPGEGWRVDDPARNLQAVWNALAEIGVNQEAAFARWMSVRDLPAEVMGMSPRELNGRLLEHFGPSEVEH